MNESSEDDVCVYRGVGLTQCYKPIKREKHFIFDLDETIGSFSDLYLLYTCLDDVGKEHVTLLLPEPSIIVKTLLALYPEFFRCGIVSILQFLYYKKQQRICGGVHIYTNTQCIPDTWTYFITDFIEEHYNMSGLFDQIIRAFKINGEVVEHRRTTHAKTYSDLIQCILIPPKTELCFIDNTFFPKMKTRYMFYIQPKPYFHGLSKKTVIDRFLDSNLGQAFARNINCDLKTQMITWYKNRGYELNRHPISPAETETDILVSKKIMYHIREFFYLVSKTPKTRRRRSVHEVLQSKTRKLRRDIGNNL